MGFETTTEDVIQGIDLTGRVALVTGASSGLGAETARVLASAGAAVTLTARDIPKVEKVAEEIRRRPAPRWTWERSRSIARTACARLPRSGWRTTTCCTC